MTRCGLASLLLLSLILLGLLPVINATSLTVNIPPKRRECFYQTVETVPKKVLFYFAVQAGGNFDIGFTVAYPNKELVASGSRERQADFVFNAPVAGDYAFCFDNTFSTLQDKTVFFDIAVEGDTTAKYQPDPTEHPADTKSSQVDTGPLEEALASLRAKATSYQRSQKFYRTREARNLDTVVSTESRVFYFALVESGMIVLMAVLQVFVLRNFFKTPRRY